MTVYTLTVRASAARDEVVKTGEETFDIHTKAPAKKGKANKEAIKLLSKHLGVPQSMLMLTKGEKFHIKTVLLLDR